MSKWRPAWGLFVLLACSAGFANACAHRRPAIALIVLPGMLTAPVDIGRRLAERYNA